MLLTTRVRLLTDVQIKGADVGAGEVVEISRTAAESWIRRKIAELAGPDPGGELEVAAVDPVGETPEETRPKRRKRKS